MSPGVRFRVSNILAGRFRSIVGVQALGVREFSIVAATILKN